MFENKKSWFDACSLESMNMVLSTSPGKIRSLINREFEVISPWRKKGIKSISGRSFYRDIWIVGVTGIVAYIGYHDSSGWFVNVEYRGPEDFRLMGYDEFDLDIPINEFLLHTKPVDETDLGPSSISMLKALNDDQY